MPGLLSDARKTALGACGLLVLAVLVADPSGMGGKVAASGEAATPAATAGTRTAPKAASWFAASNAEPEPQPAINAVTGPPRQQAGAASPATQREPEPVGADFPPGLRPRYPGG